jgi:two-component sensor histidine kinase/ligand-binding sensor domain-containing protein
MKRLCLPKKSKRIIANKKSNMSVFKTLFWTVISLLFSFILRGQTIPYKLYTPQDGLAQSQVQCLFQDSRGYIWAGTADGLSYFNGVKFTSILAKDGLLYSSIRQIQEDKKGNIIFSCGKYICTYDGEKLTADTLNIELRERIFCIDNQGIAWGINDIDKKIYFSNDYKKWVCASEKYPLLANELWSYAAFDAKLSRFNLATNSGDFYTFDKKDLIKMHSSPSVRLVLHDSKIPQNLVSIKDSIFQIQAQGLAFLSKANSSEIFHLIRRENGTIYYLVGQSNIIHSIDKSGRKDSVVLKATVNFLFIDRDKNTWAASEQGLIRLFYDGFRNFDPKEMSQIWSMIEDKRGGMWFGSYFKSAEIKHLENGKLTTKTIDYNVKPVIPKQFGNFYFGSGRDAKGNLYFSMNWGIMKYDGKTFSAFDKPIIPNSISMGLLMDNVRNCLVSSTDRGVNIVDLTNGATKFYGEAKGLHKSRYVLGVGKDTKNNYWFCTTDGIARFDIERDSIVKNYTLANHNFPFDGTLTIFGDNRGSIWAGCTRGLLKYDEQGDSFRLIAEDVIKRNVASIGIYKDQYLVIGASDGVYFLDLKAFYTEGASNVGFGKSGVGRSPKSDGINPKSIVVRCFNQYNGYLGIEPNQNCLYIDSKDNVWIAASDIVTKITPSELNREPQTLTPYITTINNDRIPYANYNQAIALPYGENTAKIFFEAVGFERPFNTEFRFKLDNQEWSKWRTEDFAVLDNLRSGTYSFSVQTRPAGTVDENEIKSTSIRFKINISIHKEPYFPFLGFMILVAGVIGVFTYFRTRNQREKAAAERHEIDIEQRKNAELLNIEITHRVKNNLNITQRIMSMQSLRAKQDETKKVLQEVMDRIQAMAVLHNHLVAKRGVETLQMGSYVRSLCENVKKSYADYSKNLTFQVGISAIELPEKMGRDIGLIVSELLTNSIKHAFDNQENPLVTIHLTETPTSVLLVYKDNGCGVPTTVNWQESDSLGLIIIHGIAESFKGKVVFENRDGLHCQVNFQKKTKSLQI